MKIKILFLPIILLLLIIPLKSVLADGLVPCGLNGTADCTLCHLVLGIKGIFDFLLKLLLAACLLGITIAGVLYMVSAGSKGLIEKAKKAFTSSIIALVLLLCSWLVVNAVMNALGFKQAGSWSSFTCDTTQTVSPSITSTTTSATATTSNSANSTSSTATTATGTGGKIVGTGLVSSGKKTLAEAASDLAAKTIYVDREKSSKVGWVDGTFYGDCSSFVQEFYKEAYGIDPGGSTEDMLKSANGSTDESSLKPGDAIVTKTKNGRHALVYMGDGQVMGNSDVGVNVKYGKLSSYSGKILGVIKAPSS